MKLSPTVLAGLSLAAGVAASNYHQLKLGFNDVPRKCAAICRPIILLAEQCKVDNSGVGDGKYKDLLHNQCVCTNKSFDVGEIAAECADCIHQHVKSSKRDLWSRRDDDDDDDDDDDGDDDDNFNVDSDSEDGLKDIDRLVSACGFTSKKYDPTMELTATTITPDATAPTHTDQLFTTIAGTRSGNTAPTAAAQQILYAGAAAAVAAML